MGMQLLMKIKILILGMELIFEHCDPTHKLLPKESGNIQGQRGVGHKWIWC